MAWVVEQEINLHDPSIEEQEFYLDEATKEQLKLTSRTLSRTIDKNIHEMDEMLRELFELNRETRRSKKRSRKSKNRKSKRTKSCVDKDSENDSGISVSW